VPHKKLNFYKFWWDSELDKLKELSINAHTVWKEACKPKSGPVYAANRISHANYKLAINHKRDYSPDSFTNDGTHGGFGYGSRNADGVPGYGVCRWAKFSHLQHTVYETGSQVGNICSWSGEKYS